MAVCEGIIIIMIIRMENSDGYAESPAPLWPGGIGARLSRTFAATQPPLQRCAQGSATHRSATGWAIKPTTEQPSQAAPRVSDPAANLRGLTT